MYNLSIIKPLNTANPSQFTKNIDDLEDSQSTKKDVLMVNSIVASRMKDRKVGVPWKTSRKRKQTTPASSSRLLARRHKSLLRRVVKLPTYNSCSSHIFPKVKRAKGVQRLPLGSLTRHPSILERDKTHELTSTLTRVRAKSDAIQEKEKVKDMEYVELETNKLHAEYNRLVLEEKNLVTYKQDRVAVVSKVIPYIPIELAYSDEMAKHVAQLVNAAIIHGRCLSFKEVAALKEPFELTKMFGYRPFLKKYYDQVGNKLGTDVYPFLDEATSDPYASI
nr:hypothetical protein [Tanacetum cinerariifolium]